MTGGRGPVRRSERGRWKPGREEERALLSRLEAHLESGEVMGLEVGRGPEVIDFLATLRDMSHVEGLLLGFDASPREREWLLNQVEEGIGRLAERERRKGWFRWRR